MRRKAMTLREVAAIIFVLLGTAWILIPWGHIGSGRRARERYECQSNLKQIALAFGQYAQDSDERFPSLHTTKGWRAAVAPYLRNEELFHCPSEGGDETLGYSDYWFNARLSEINTQSLSLPVQTFLLGDGYSSGDPRVSLSQLPQSWRDDENSPAHRHLDGANYAFADGHVRFLRNQSVTTQKPSDTRYTFAVR